MRNLFVLLVSVLLGSVNAVGAISNENSPCVTVIDLGSPSADLLLPGAYAYKSMKLVSVALVNGAAIAASNTDYVQLELKSGSTVLAELDSRAAHENGIAMNTGEALNLVAAEALLAAGASLTVNYNETDSGSAVALTDAKLVLTWHTK